MTTHRSVTVEAAGVQLEGDLALPGDAASVVVFAHGSGSSRHSPRNRYVAQALNSAGLGTLLFDLLTLDEESIDLHTRELRFDIGLLGRRVIGAVDWLGEQRDTADLAIGLFGASTGAAAALVAAAERPDAVRTVVSRGGRPDLAGNRLERVRCPSLFVVGGQDRQVIALNQEAIAQMQVPARLEIVSGATHLFEEPGALDRVVALAAGWFREHLPVTAAAST